MSNDRPIGGRAFRLGLLFLPSSALLAAVSLLIACISGSRGREQPLWRDRWCQPLLLAGLLCPAVKQAFLQLDGLLLPALAVELAGARFTADRLKG